jgi:hypothetical protein
MLKILTMLATGIPALIAATLVSMGRKWITLSAAIACWVVLTAAFIAAVNVCIAEMAGLLSPPAWLLNAVGMFVPADFGAVLGCTMAVRISRYAYEVAIGKVKMFATAT